MKGQNHDGKSKVTAQFPHEEALCIRISAKWTVPDRDVGLKARARQTALKFIYSEKATKFSKISILLLSYVVPIKSKVKISKKFVAFSEYMNFKAGILK